MIVQPHTETHAAKRARQRREQAQRTRAWRTARRERRIPEARAIDAAVAEAVAFAIRRNSKKIAAGAQIAIPLADIVNVAAIALRRDGYAFAESRRRLVERLDPGTKFDGFGSVPSIASHAGPVDLIAPRGAEAWTAAEIEVIRKFMWLGDATTVRESISENSAAVRREISEA